MPSTAVFAKGSTALITGAASGIGLAVAKLCRSKGMKLLLADRDAAALETAKKELGSDTDDVVALETDVSNLGDWQKLEDKAVQSFGTIEFLALNAGTGMKGTWEDGDFFRKVLHGLILVRLLKCMLTKSTDARDQPLWGHQWHPDIPAPHQAGGSVKANLDCHHGEQTGHHQPPR